MGDNLADFIERCILGKFIKAEEEHIMMRRNDLALELSCAPSQISYVLSTRFTPERGFVVKSRRGTGGFVQIIRILPTNKHRAHESEPEQTAQALLERLLESRMVSRREYALLHQLLEIKAVGLDSDKQFDLLRTALKRMHEFA